MVVMLKYNVCKEKVEFTNFMVACVWLDKNYLRNNGKVIQKIFLCNNTLKLAFTIID